MKDERKNIKEPYSPDNTPNPPQIIDPSRRKEQGEDEKPIENKQSAQPSSNDKNEYTTSRDSSKKLGESEPDIHDETTI